MIELIFPSKHHLALKFLGGKKFLDLAVDPEKGTIGNLVSAIPVTREDSRNYSREDILEAKNLLRDYASHGSASAFYLMQLSRAIADGPKMFRATMEQCIALENTEVNVPFENYKQPYPTVIIELPKEYRDHLCSKFNTDQSPRFILSHKQEPENIVSVTAWFDTNDQITNVLSPRSGIKTIEDAMVANRDRTTTNFTEFYELRKELGEEKASQVERIMTEESDEDFSIAEIVQRLTINFSMMMTMLGTRVVGPLNTTQEKIDKNRKIVNKKGVSDGERHRSQKILARVTMLTEFDQHIKFSEKTSVSQKSDEHTGPKLKTHWRRGYWRLQWHGPANTLFKYVFIQPVLVNIQFFTGDLSATSVTYTPKAS